MSFKNFRGQVINDISWPYDKDKIKVLIQALTNGEPYQLNTPGAKMAYGLNAQNAITCGTHVLDVNYEDYYWDGTKIELPAQELKAEVHGDHNIIVQGNDNEVSLSPPSNESILTHVA